jgi:drug/metabolite transporter (DMT)-like permease
VKYAIYIKLIFVAIFWGISFLTTKIAGNSFHPFFGGFLRFSVALTILLPLVYVKDGFPKLAQRQWLEFIGLSFVGIFFYNVCFFAGLQRVPASRGSLLMAVTPSMVLAGSMLFMGEKATLPKVAGIFISLLGACIVISRGDLLHIVQQFELGDLILSGCPIAWSAYTLLGRHVFRGVSSLTATTISVFFGWAMLGIASLLVDKTMTNVPMEAWLSLAYLGIFVTAIGYIWYSEGIRTIGATRTAIFNNFVPVFGILSSVLFLKESVPISAFIGGVLVVGGAVLTNK